MKKNKFNFFPEINQEDFNRLKKVLQINKL